MTVTEEGGVAYFRQNGQEADTWAGAPKGENEPFQWKAGERTSLSEEQRLRVRRNSWWPRTRRRLSGWSVVRVNKESKRELAREVGRSQVIRLVHMGRRGLKFIARALVRVSRRGSVMGWFSVLNVENGLVNGKVIGVRPVRRLSPETKLKIAKAWME